MKLVGEKRALETLNKLISDFKFEISNRFEHRAKDCGKCDVKGSCCLDAHFVNVHISRLEAANIRQKLTEFPEPHRSRINRRIAKTVAEYDLSSDGDTYSQTYACPLFEKESGCLIHDIKPAACTIHACYENRSDLPPDALQFEQERKIDRLNQLTYGRRDPWLPLPLAITGNNKNDQTEAP